MDEADQHRLLMFARKSLESYLDYQHLPDFKQLDSPPLVEEAGAFVSVYVSGKLRGCIGHIEKDKPLSRVVQEMVIAAATRDSRFKAVEPAELADLTLEISVLSPFKLIKNLTSIKIGVHGIYIQSGRMRGLLLPQVAAQRNWTVDRFLRECCIKANLPGEAYTWPKTRISTFKADIIQE